MTGKVTTPALYLLRHGQTAFNASGNGGQDKIRGWTDVPLDPEGIQEAKEMAEELSEMFPPPQSGEFPVGPPQIFASDLSRALDTARVVAAPMAVQVIPTTALRPWNLGVFQGKPTERWLKASDRYVFERPNDRIPDGESLVDFTNRFIPFLNFMLDQVETSGRSQLAVTHYRNMKAAEAWIKGGRLSLDLPTFMEFSNASDPAELHRIYRKGRNGPWAYQIVDDRSHKTGSGGSARDKGGS